MLRIRLADPHQAPSLVARLRAERCIAYVVADGVVAALLPDVSEREEERRVRAAVDGWREAHDAGVRFERLEP